MWRRLHLTIEDSTRPNSDYASAREEINNPDYADMARERSSAMTMMVGAKLLKRSVRVVCSEAENHGIVPTVDRELISSTRSALYISACALVTGGPCTYGEDLICPVLVNDSIIH